MAIQWSKALQTGISWQDQQHIKLIEKMNDLLEAMKQNRGREQVSSLLEFLEKYVVHHFGTEERYMQANNFKGYHHHKSVHDEFKTVLGELIKLHHRQGNSTMLILRVQSQLCDWILDHLGGLDKTLKTIVPKKPQNDEAILRA